ncbi:MAG TPA: hypothetical protein VK666_13600 [Chryseolinea sp.]|nr:hypothetical protein [Chryseolinea sp.]
MYEEKIVMFIDILGFKELVEKKGFEVVDAVYTEFGKMIDNMNKDLQDSIRVFQTIDHQKRGTKFEFKKGMEEILFFSDCVVWSYPVSGVSSIPFVLVLIAMYNSLSIIYNNLFGNGILIRGGVSIGKLYQKGSKVFGEGLVKAYILETKTYYPRIAFDREMFLSVTHHQWKMIKDFYLYNIKGFFTFNYFGLVKQICENDATAELRSILIGFQVEPLIRAIESGEEIQVGSVRQKYDWLKLKLMTVPNIDKYYKIRHFGGGPRSLQ